MKPFQITRESNIYTVPCGKCPYCKKRRASNWSFRLREEEKNSSSSLFITLTYNNENIPISDNGFMTLNKRDVQLFMKRLRKLYKHKLVYYLVGEYGGMFGRPHYHMIIFNAKFNDIEKTWDLGHTHCGKVQDASIGYCLKYISKDSDVPKHERDDRVKEFALMSKGIGKNYVNEVMVKWHKEDLLQRMYVNLEEGKKASMPRYYKDKIYNTEERGQLKAHHTQKITEKLEELAYDININKIMKAYKESVKHQFKKLKIKDL